MEKVKRTKVVDLLKSTDYGSIVNVKGWVRTHRSSKAVDFIALNDGSTINNIQIVVDPSKVDENQLRHAMEVQPEVVQTPNPTPEVVQTPVMETPVSIDPAPAVEAPDETQTQSTNIFDNPIPSITPIEPTPVVNEPIGTAPAFDEPILSDNSFNTTSPTTPNYYKRNERLKD